MGTFIEILDNDPKGERGGTLYKLTPPAVEVLLSDMLDKTDAELMVMFYPKDIIDYIRRLMVS